MLDVGGFLLFGDGVWERVPSAGYLAFLGAQPEDLGSFDELLVAGLRFGLKAISSYHSTQMDWDSFEDHYYSTMIRWFDANPKDSDSEAFRSPMTIWRENYLIEGRGTLGFGTILSERT
jgi:hypothetical protein